jgi:Regulator of G protein signaling domain
VQFWLDVERFRGESHPSDVAYLRDAAHLYALYLRPGSEREVNISSSVRASTLQAMSSAAAALASSRKQSSGSAVSPCSSPTAAAAVAAVASLSEEAQALLQGDAPVTVTGATVTGATVADVTVADAGAGSSTEQSAEHVTATSDPAGDAPGVTLTETAADCVNSSSEQKMAVSDAPSTCAADKSTDDCGSGSSCRHSSSSDSTVELSPAHSASGHCDSDHSCSESAASTTTATAAAAATDSSTAEVQPPQSDSVTAAAADTGSSDQEGSRRQSRALTSEEEFFDAEATTAATADSGTDSTQAAVALVAADDVADDRSDTVEADSTDSTTTTGTGATAAETAAAVTSDNGAVSEARVKHSSLNKARGSVYFSALSVQETTAAVAAVAAAAVPDGLDHTIFDAAQRSVFQVS